MMSGYDLLVHVAILLLLLPNPSQGLSENSAQWQNWNESLSDSFPSLEDSSRNLQTCSDNTRWYRLSKNKLKKRNCAWVATKPEKRCRADRIGAGGFSFVEACGKTCNSCNPITTSALNNCRDDPTFFYIAPKDGKRKTCDFFAKNPSGRCKSHKIGSNLISPFEACPFSCRSCSGNSNYSVDGERTASQDIVDKLDFTKFKDNVKQLSLKGDRKQGTEKYANAEKWVIKELQSYGYEVEQDNWYFGSQDYKGSRYRKNTWVTKVGATRPWEMYIVSAHLDGRGGGGAANDDGSGSALVLEIARAYASANVTTERSIRFIFWNAEETGLDGAYAYVDARHEMQGDESETVPGTYPEPKWLGMITHDQILFDHGSPWTPEQSPNADADIEYRRGTTFAAQSENLGMLLKHGNEKFSESYPAEVTDDMCCTDSYAFINHCPAVSIRENRRIAEMGKGNAAPHWHQPSDKWDTYSEADYRFGMDIVRTTAGTVGELVDVQIIPK